jgi:hypothetical protein
MQTLVFTPQSPTGNFTGLHFRQDPDTGFLEADPELAKTFDYGAQASATFNGFKKAQFLNALYDCWPNVSKACARVGISRWTFNNHYGADEAFKSCVDLIREKVIDHIDNVRMAVAQTPSGSFDRMCVLNAYRRELYNPKQVIEVQHSLTIEQTQAQRARMESAIDAEVVETVRRVKAARRKESRP